MSLKPVCVKCHRFYRMKKAGFSFTEAMPANGVARPEPGLAEPGSWKPYKVWIADLWECRGCGAQILSGFGANPVSVRHMDDFNKTIDRLGADRFQVNDC